MEIEDQRPFFAELRRKHKFDPLILARLAATEPFVVLAMLRAHPVRRALAMKVLNALSQMTGECYCLSTVRVPLKEEEHGCTATKVR